MMFLRPFQGFLGNCAFIVCREIEFVNTSVRDTTADPHASPTQTTLSPRQRTVQR